MIEAIDDKFKKIVFGSPGNFMDKMEYQLLDDNPVHNAYAALDYDKIRDRIVRIDDNLVSKH